eukprot:scaffold85014_cov36-Tisochrysis_lutea.AAC.1
MGRSAAPIGASAPPVVLLADVERKAELDTICEVFRPARFVARPRFPPRATLRPEPRGGGVDALLGTRTLEVTLSLALPSATTAAVALRTAGEMFALASIRAYLLGRSEAHMAHCKCWMTFT